MIALPTAIKGSQMLSGSSIGMSESISSHLVVRPSLRPLQFGRRPGTAGVVGGAGRRRSGSDRLSRTLHAGRWGWFLLGPFHCRRLGGENTNFLVELRGPGYGIVPTRGPGVAPQQP